MAYAHTLTCCLCDIPSNVVCCILGLFGCCRLKDVTSCASAFQAPESGLPAKLKHCQGQLDSPERLQKRLVELGERCMQVVLSMDELHSENDKVCISGWLAGWLSEVISVWCFA